MPPLSVVVAIVAAVVAIVVENIHTVVVVVVGGAGGAITSCNDEDPENEAADNWAPDGHAAAPREAAAAVSPDSLIFLLAVVAGRGALALLLVRFLWHDRLTHHLRLLHHHGLSIGSHHLLLLHGLHLHGLHLHGLSIGTHHHLLLLHGLNLHGLTHLWLLHGCFGCGHFPFFVT